MKTNLVQATTMPCYVEMNKGEILMFRLADGKTREIKLKDTSKDRVTVEINGQELTLKTPAAGDPAKMSYTSEMVGVRMGLEMTRIMSDSMTTDYNKSHLNLLKDARLHLSDAGMPLTPKGKHVFPVPGRQWEQGCCWLNGVDYGSHMGTDISGAIGTPIVSVTDGKVVAYRKFTPGVDKDDLWGRVVAVLGDDGVLYYYCHFDSVAPQIDKDVRVKKGEQLGTLGNAGFGIALKNVRPHLHFQMVMLRTAKTDFGPINTGYAGLFHAREIDGFTINSTPYMLQWYREMQPVVDFGR